LQSIHKSPESDVARIGYRGRRFADRSGEHFIVESAHDRIAARRDVLVFGDYIAVDVRTASRRAPYGGILAVAPLALNAVLLGTAGGPAPKRSRSAPANAVIVDGDV